MALRGVAGWIVVALASAGLVGTVVLLVAELSRVSFPWSLLVLVGAALGFGTALAFLRVGLRLARPPSAPSAPPAPRRVTPVPEVRADEAETLPKPITACPDCGFLGIRMPTIHDGLWPGGGETGGRFVCPRCDWQGLPVSFASGAAYADYVRDLHGRPAAEVAP